jgi:hypothetical protein
MAAAQVDIMLGRSWKSGLRIGCCAAALSLLSVAAAQASMVISDKPTKNVSCSSGICSATARKAVLNVNELAGMLASGDVTLTSGSLAQDIQIGDALSWTSTSRLTLDSYHSIFFNKSVVVAGTGALTITVNDGGSGGDFAFSDKGHVEFWDAASSLTIAGTSYKLVRTTSDLQHAVRNNPNGFFALARNASAKKDGVYTRQFVADVEGTIEGLGNKISNFLMQSKNGEVAFISENHGTIRDLTLAKADVTGRTNLVAGLVAHNFGMIRNSSVSGRIAGSGSGSYMGGLVAYNEGLISGSQTDANVDGSAGYTVGGLVGFNYVLGSDITTSHAAGAVIGSSGFAGGLVGESDGGTISQSYATAFVSGSGVVGGFAGSSSGLVSNAYATGSVNGETAGGFVGEAGGSSTTITNAYSTGAVSGSVSQGGFAGEDSGQVIATSYWDLDTSGISNSSQGAGNVQNDPGITGLTDPQLKAGLPSGFDPSVWIENSGVNNGYPYLRASPPD